MPGYVIHIAIAQEYLKNHAEKNNEEFIKGVISPDMTDDKTKTHYGKSPAYTDLKKFLLNNEIENSFTRGQFLHLITDYLFYNHYLTKFIKGALYRDYDRTNKNLIEKYNVKLPNEIKSKVSFIDGETEVLTLDMACKVIEEISKYDLDKVKEEILQKEDKKWNTYKNMI